MDYSDLITILLCFTALLLIRQIVLSSRRNSVDSDVDDYTGMALDPDALTRVDEHSMREFDRLLDNISFEDE